MEEKVIKQFSAKIEKSLNQDGQFEDDKFFYVKSYISTYDIDLGKDIVSKGAFTNSIAERTKNGKVIPALWQHDMFSPVGHAINITEDEKGIMVESRLPKAHWRVKEEIIPLMENGTLQEMSIGFSVKRQEYDKETNIRIIKEGNLFEYSFVTLAMNPEATIESFKSLENLKDERDIEKLLKQKGCSNTESKTMISVMKKILKSSNLRDEVKEESDTQRDVEEKTQETIDQEAILKAIDDISILNKLNQLCQTKS
jgi:HK97 family phage prohead protease